MWRNLVIVQPVSNKGIGLLMKLVQVHHVHD